MLCVLGKCVLIFHYYLLCLSHTMMTILSHHARRWLCCCRRSIHWCFYYSRVTRKKKKNRNWQQIRGARFEKRQAHTYMTFFSFNLFITQVHHLSLIFHSYWVSDETTHNDEQVTKGSKHVHIIQSFEFNEMAISEKNVHASQTDRLYRAHYKRLSTEVMTIFTSHFDKLFYFV